MKTADLQEDGRQVARRVARNSLYLLFSRTLGILIRIAIIPIVARYLGVESFGFYALILAISMSITPLADFGLNRIVCRELAKTNTDGDQYVSTAMAMRIVFSLFLLLVGIFILARFSDWNQSIKLALIIAIAAELIFSMGDTYFAVIMAFERMEYDVFANIAHKLSLFAFILLVVFFDLGLLFVFIARLGAAIIYFAISAIYSYKLFVKFTFHFNSGLAKYIIKESFPIALFGLLLALIFRVDIFLLKWLATERAIALFEVPHRLIIQMQLFATSMIFAIFPVLSRHSMDKVKDSLQQYYRKAYKILFIAGVFFTTLMYIGEKPLIVTIFGNDFSEALIPMKILAPTLIPLFLVLLQNSFLVAINRQVLNIISTGVAITINIALDILLIPTYTYAGASIATLISYCVYMAIGANFVKKQGINLDIGASIFKILAAGLVMYLAAFLEIGGNIETLILRSCLGVMLFIITLFALKTMDQGEVDVIKRLFAGKRSFA